MNETTMNTFMITVAVMMVVLLVGYFLLSIPAFLYGRRLKVKSSWCLFFPIIRMIPMTNIAKLETKSKRWYYTFAIVSPILAFILTPLTGSLGFLVYYFFLTFFDTFLYAKMAKNGGVNVAVRTFINMSSGGFGFIGAKPSVSTFEKSKETRFFDLES